MCKEFQCVLILFISLLFSTTVFSQDYEWAKAVNPLDSGQITAQAIASNGDVYIASYKQKVYISYGDFGASTNRVKGKMYISKLNNLGEPIWSNVFENSVGRIFDMTLDANSDLIISGGYYDTLKLSSSVIHPGSTLNMSSFIAKFDTSGSLIWSNTNVATNTDLVSRGLEVFEEHIYEVGNFYSYSPSIRKFNSSGDTVATKNFTTLGTINDLKIDDLGEIYLTASSFPNAFIDPIYLPEPPNNTSYLNALIKLDEDFNGLWARTSNHITFDHDQEVELFAGKLAFLSVDYPNGSLGGFQLNINYYSLDGDSLFTDSLTNIFSINPNGSTTISSTENNLLIAFTEIAGGLGGTDLAFYSVDSTLEKTLFSQIELKTFKNYPAFITNDDYMFLTTSFYSPYAIVNTQDTVYNLPNASIYEDTYRQMLVKFELPFVCSQTDSLYAIESCESYASPSGIAVWDESGIYYDTLINNGGCDSVLTIDFTVLEVDTIVELMGAELSAQADSASYKWFNCNTNENIDGEIEALYTVVDNGSYAVAITQNGCTDTSACFVINDIGITEEYTNVLGISPNPSSTGVFLIEFNKSLRNKVVAVYNSQGQIVLSKMVQNQSQMNLILPVSAGVYFMKVQSDRNVEVHRIVISK